MRINHDAFTKKFLLFGTFFMYIQENKGFSLFFSELKMSAE